MMPSTHSEKKSFVVKTVARYKSSKSGELSFKKGQKITVTMTNDKTFRYFGMLDGKQGWFPCLYAKPIEDIEATEKFKKKAKAMKGDAKIPESPDATRNRGVSVFRNHVSRAFTSDNPSKRRETISVVENPVLKTGMLKRQLGHGKSVKIANYWIVLRHNELSFFQSAGIKKPLHKIPTSQITKLQSDKTEKDTFWFSMQAGRKKYLLGTTSNDERESWIKEILVSSTGNSDSSPAVVLEPTKEQLSKPSSEQKPSVPLPRLKRMSRVDVIKRGQDGMFKQLLQMDTASIDDALEGNGMAPVGAGDVRKSTIFLRSSVDFDAEDNDEEEEEEEKTKSPLISDHIGKVRAIADYYADSVDGISFKKNDVFELVKKTQPSGWWLGEYNGSIGYFPSSYVKLLTENFQEKSNDSNKNVGRNRKAKKKNYAEQVGPFILQDIIGHTVFGSNKYTGEHLINKTTVAISQYPAHLYTRQEKNLIIRKMNQLSKLKHENIIEHKGAIGTDKFFNIVTNFTPAESLGEKIDRFGPLKESVLIPHIKSVLEGLKFLHSNDVIHGRIRASNILVDKNTNGIILGEHGFIDILNADSDRRPIEPPYWSAPEILQQKNLGVGLDIWSLGCTIIELLTGSAPFSNLSYVEATFAMVEKGPIQLIPPTCSPVMKSFLKLCFIENSYCRPTPKELLDNIIFSQRSSFAPKPLRPTRSDLIKRKSKEKSKEEFEENVEEETEFEKDKRICVELANWFKNAMDAENVSHAIQLRKAVRDKRKLIYSKEDPNYEPLKIQLRTLMHRCEDEMGEHIPLDSDDCEFSDDYSDEFYEDDFLDEDDIFM